MEYVEGRIFKNPLLPKLSPKDRSEIYASFISTLAKLQSFNYKEIGLEGFGRSERYYERQVCYKMGY
jgi:aminoglycoside phosphotransferase (APT) family kinase protein